MPVATITWQGGLNGRLEIIDQTLLPGEFKIITCDSVAGVWDAIKQLRVRGAPAIGIAAAMGAVVGVRDVSSDAPEKELFAKLYEVTDYLATSRPTAPGRSAAATRSAPRSTTSCARGFRQQAASPSAK